MPNRTLFISGTPRGWIPTDAENKIIPEANIRRLASGTQILIEPIQGYDFSSINLYSPDFSVKVVVPYAKDYEADNQVIFADLPQITGVGAVDVRSELKFTVARLLTTAGGVVAQAYDKDGAALFTFVNPDTYTIETLGLDGTTPLQRIDGVGVAAGRVSSVYLTEAAVVQNSDQPTEENPSTEETPSTNGLHRIVLTGLQAGDQATLLRGTDQAATAIAQGNADINFNGLADADYTVNVMFTNGTMANRYTQLTAESSEIVTFDMSDARSPVRELINDPNGDSHVTWWVLGGIAATIGGLWYADKQGYIK